MTSRSHQIAIVGAGSAGISVAARLLNENPDLDVAIIDPSEKHYYQPIWTLVGGGVFDRSISERDQADLIPSDAAWIKERVTGFDPDNNQISLGDGSTVSYEFLVVAAGIQISWGSIPGLKETVGKPGTGVVSNYDFKTVAQTFKEIQAFPRGGKAVFTHPATPIKCGGAPMKIMFLADEAFRRQGVRSGSSITFVKGGPGIFAVKKYAEALTQVADKKGIERIWMHDLTALRPESKEAVFRNMASDEELVLSYDLIHVTPPMSAPAFIAESKLAADSGWVEVDKHTTQHVRYSNVFSLGDCSNLPTSKTGAAIRKQAPTTAENLLSVIAGKAPTKHYDGYTSCPLVTGYGKLILAEFDYDKQPAETFPFDQARERYSMYALKAYGLPEMYWNGMLRGRM